METLNEVFSQEEINNLPIVQEIPSLPIPEVIPTEGKEKALLIDNDIYTFPCPHCADFVQVSRHEVHCAIFRHGYYYTNDSAGNIILIGQLNPHASKEECESAVSSGKLLGCGKPFRMIPKNGPEGLEYYVSECEYL